MERQRGENRPRKAENRFRSFQQRPGPPLRQPPRFTPLNAPTCRSILIQIQGDPYFKWPEQMKSNPVCCWKKKYCQFHQDHGHDTEYYFDLWRLLDKLIRGGKI
jgi:hypothetical protein